MSKFRFMPLLLLVSMALVHAEPVYTYSFICDINGAPARMTSQVEMLPDRYGGVVTRSAGEIRSQSTYYSYVGEGEYAEMVDHGSNQRFRIRFELAQGGVYIVPNPFESGHGYEGSARYWCKSSQ